MNRAILLGCGGSMGVPSATGEWDQCDSANPLNRRHRASLLIEAADAAGVTRRIVIDTGPDFHDQAVAVGLSDIDAVLYTHAHADHLHGIDELRSFNRSMRRPIPIWASPATMEQIQLRFAYVLVAPEGRQFFRPTLIPHVIDGPFTAAGIPIIPFEQDHGFSLSTGFRIGNLAYSTDVVRLSEAAFACLDGVETWIVDCVRREPHPVHSHLANSLAWISRVKPKRAILTHMDASLDYNDLRAVLPSGVEPGFDGMVLEF